MNPVLRAVKPLLQDKPDGRIGSTSVILVKFAASFKSIFTTWHKSNSET